MNETPENSEDSKKATDNLLRIARERFELAAESETEIRTLALEDQKFRAGEQWPSEVKRQREADGRPCLVINRIPQFIQQVTNDQRQNRPSLKVHPVDDQADIETAKIFQGMIRHIEYNSNADVAYDTAFESTVTGGRGFFRVITDYVDPMSFEQEILIKRIRNPHSVYMDPASKEPDGSDMNWCFVVDSISKDEFTRLYPEASLSEMTDWSSIGDQFKGWVEEEKIRIAEYFYREYSEQEIVMLVDGSVGLKSQLPPNFPKQQIANERKTKVPVIKWCKINGGDILEQTEWLGRWIPVIPVYGTELDIDGKVVYEGIVRHAKDPQRMYNYWTSSETETIALAPRAPFIGVEGQFEGHEAQWEMANRKNFAFLQYKPIDLNGTPFPAPQRNIFEPPVAAISNAKALSGDDLKATTGIYDAALGARSNEQSGIAIQRRNIQTQTSNFHFIDNLTRSLRHLGRILVDLIPKVYDTPQATRIVGEDGEQEVVLINKIFERKGKQVEYKLSTGKYDVVVETGPSFATKRQEAAASMLELSKANPAIMGAAGDLVVKNMDLPGASEIAERIKKTLPPGLADDPNKKQPLPPEVQAQMQQMDQMVQQLTEHLNAANKEIETKKFELESKERIAFAQMQTDLNIALAKMESQGNLVAFQEELAMLHKRLELLNINQSLESEMVGANSAAPIAQDVQQPTGGSSPGLPME